MIDTIINSFDIWTDAQGIKSRTRIRSVDNIRLEGIAKLREVILELAIQGKLVPQNQSDEPAVELLQRIEKERIRMIKEGDFKKLDSFAEIKENKTPFNLPKNWGMTQLGLVCEIIRGITFSSSEKSNLPEVGRIACIRTTNVQDKIEWDDLLFIREVLVTRKNQFLKVNDIVMSMANSKELVGKVAIVDNLHKIKATFGGFLGVLRPIFIDPYYLMLILRSKTNRDSLIDSASQTTNIANISLAKLYPLKLALPPLAEQHRIVAKVDEFMALCDKLEAEQFNNLKTHQALVKTLLETLTQAADANELQTAWERMAEHFDTLFWTEDSIEQLKQTILQLAVMGKLVKQNPNDEPASQLLKKIEKEKERLGKDGKIKKQVFLTKIKDDEKLFELPNGWDWCRLNEVSKQITDGEHITPPRIDNGYKLLSAKNVREGFIDYENCDYVSQEVYEKCIKRCNPEIGDLLIISVGGTIGRTSLIRKDIPFVIVRSVAMIKPLIIESKYLELVMNSPLLQRIIANKSRGGAQPCLYLNEIVKFSFPLPPLTEQPRIVSKVKELFTLCDSLIEKTKKSQEIKISLSKTIIEKVVK